MWTTVIVWCDQFPQWSFDYTSVAGNRLLLLGTQNSFHYNIRFYIEIWCFSTWSHLKFMNEVPKRTAPKWITLNQNTWSQTKFCITKSSCEKCALLRHMSCTAVIPYRCFMATHWSHLQLTRNPEEFRAWPKLPDTHKTYILRLYPSSNSFKQARCFIAKLALILFPGKEAPKLVDTSDWVILNHWAPHYTLSSNFNTTLWNRNSSAASSGKHNSQFKSGLTFDIQCEVGPFFALFIVGL